MKEPKIRFKEFEGEWEENTFSNITIVSKKKNKDNLLLKSYSISNEYGFIPQNEQFENGGIMATANKSMYYIVTPNTFAYNPARINVGSLGYYNGKDNVIISSLYEVFKTIEQINDIYLLYWFKTLLFKKQIELLQEGGVRLYFFYDKLLKCLINYPSLAEQQSIATFFTSLDAQIKAAGERVASLKRVKAASLQAMFPQEGETTPRVRFKGFEGEWEKVSIKECLEEINEKNFPIQTDFVLSLTIKDGVLPYSEKGNIGNRAKEDHSLYKLAYPNTIVLNSMNILIGAIGVCNYFGCVSPVYYVLKETEQADLWFMYYIMSDRKFQIELNQIATGMMEIRKKVPMDELMEKAILVPNKEEQHKIADYFTSLDRQITLHTQRLEKLKQIKAACLDKMFV